jgi:hypothetical protein
MKKTEKRIKIILDELNKEKVIKTGTKNKKDFCVINLTFPVRNFYKKVSSVGDFLKKLRNNLPYNRPFFNRISNNGIYNYTIDDENVILNIFIELNEIFEKSELAPKILKLVEPSKMIISFNDDKLYEKTFNGKFIVSDWGIWGQLYRSTPVDSF